MKNILYIAYQFPPLNVGGSARPARFVKHLKKFSINPIVVTLDPLDYNKVYANAKNDSNLLTNFKDELDIIKVPSFDLLTSSKNRLSRFLDIFFSIYGSREKKYWEENYFKYVDHYLKNNDISAILVTSPPFSILPLAVETSRKHKLPLIVDMRDPWTMWNVKPYSNYLNYLRTKRQEFKVFKQASKIIATSKVTLNDFKRLHPAITAEKFEYIPNGFEEEISLRKIETKPKNRIIIGYVGSFYYSPDSRDMIFKKWWQKKGHRKLQYVPRKEDWLYRSPYFLFRTIHELFAKYPEFKDRIELHFAGKKEDWFQEMVEQFDLQSNVEHLGWLSQKDSLKFQAECDFLLITSAKVMGGLDYSIAGKTFEYFRMNKPILAFVAEGAQKDILADSNLAYFIDIDSKHKGVEQLKRLLTEPIVFSPNKSFIDSFKINNLTERLANTIEEAIKTKK